MLIHAYLSRSLVFHAVTLECSSFRENPIYNYIHYIFSTYIIIPDAEYAVLYVERFMAREVK